MDKVIGTIITLIAAAIAIFLILIAIDIALFLKLRSIIPQSPRATPPAESPGLRDPREP
jgi:hypothetical protein